MKQVFDDGSVLLTGKELDIAIEAMINKRGNYDISCEFCKHEGNEEYCEGCSHLDTDNCCSCHICPPCSYCVNSKFEVSLYLINYKHYAKGHKFKWECFKSSKEVYEKAKQIEEIGLVVSAEILTTGEIAMYIDNDEEAGENDAIEICIKKEFRNKMNEMILNYKMN